MPRIVGVMRRCRIELAVMAATTVLLCVVWTVFSVVTAHNEQHAIDRGVSDARDASRVVAAAWDEKLAEINALHYLAAAIGNAGVHGGTEREDLLIAVQEAIHQSGLDIVRVYGTDADGVVQWTTDRSAQWIAAASDRPEFRAIKGGADRFISGPMAGKVDGQLTSHFAKAVRNPDGTLRAITVVVVNSDIIDLITAEYLSVRRGVATVMRADGTVIARNIAFYPGDVGPGAAGGLIEQAATANEAVQRKRSRIDGVERFYVLRRTRGDMLVNVGLDVDGFLAPVRSQTVQYRAMAGVLSLVLLANAVGMIAGWRFRAKLKRQHEQERDLAKQEELITQIAERATDIFTLMDSEMRIIFQNPAGARLLDVNPSTRLGRRFGFAVAPEDQGVFKAALTNLMWFGGSHRLTYRIAHADGTRRWLETELIAIVPGQGTAATAACRYIAVSRDVTMRKRDEEVLRETQTQIAAMLRHGGLLYCRPQGQDGAGRIDVSPLSASMVLGYSRNCLMEPGFFASRIHPDDTAAIDAALQRCEASGDAIVEYRFSDAAGNLRWLREQMTLANRDDISSEIVVYLTDITDEHTDRQRLQQSERLATLGMVTTNIAHEMNQPLAAIGMAAENGLRALEKSMASRGFGEPDVVEQSFKLDLAVAAKLRQITSQTRRVASMISHIRKFGRADGKPELLDVKCIIDEALLLSEPRLLAAGVRPVLDIEPNLPLLRTVRMPLEQVLLNITVNACDAYDGDGAAAAHDELAERPLFISARCNPDGLMLRIADRAGGIPPETLNYIFDPFFTTKPVGAGTGVGLFVSRKNIDGLGGKLFALNEDGGAVFEIHLPLTIELEEDRLVDRRADAVAQ